MVRGAETPAEPVAFRPVSGRALPLRAAPMREGGYKLGMRNRPAAPARLAIAALAPTLVLLAALPPAMADDEAVLDPTRQRDDLELRLADAANDLRVVLPLREGARLDARLEPQDGGASGVTLTLLDPDGVPFDVTAAVTTRPGRDEARWKKLVLPRAGEWMLLASAASPGAMRLRLGGKAGGGKTVTESTEPLAGGASHAIEVFGLSGDLLKWKLTAPKGSSFKGSVVRVERPDGSALDGVEPGTKGKIALDTDGPHLFVFSNAAATAGDWSAKLVLKPANTKKRKGLVSAAQTGLVPKVQKLDPAKGVHRDTALLVTLTGRDLAPGMDVRLERKGRDDIVATDVEVTGPETATCRLDLDTRDGGESSVGGWNLVATNSPVYGTPGDPSTLDTETPLRSKVKPFKSVSAGTVKLPAGVVDGTEVWRVRFTDDFQTDLNRMGLGSTDEATRTLARRAVEGYVVAYLRDLFAVNETNGVPKDAAAVPISFVVDEFTALAGIPGEDWNRIDVGGTAQAGDPQDAAEPLPWGFAATDAGNAQRDDLVEIDGDELRLGLGARTRVLDPAGAFADPSFTTAMQPLRDLPLGAADRLLFVGRFDDGDGPTVDRYAVVVAQLERAAREIAAIVAHHVGRASGLATAGSGPMAAPATAGAMWPQRGSLTFAAGDAAALRGALVPHALPGKSDRLKVSFLPLANRQPELLPLLTGGSPFTATWDFVGGRANAVPSDYRMQFVQGSGVPPGLTLTFTSLAGTMPVCRDGGQCQNIQQVICGIFSFQLAVTDTVRDDVTFHFHRVKAVPDLNLLPAAIRPQAAQCRNEVLAAP